MADADAKRRAREARESAELADAIEKCWRSRFGAITVYAQIELARMRRGDRAPPEEPENEATPEGESGARTVCQDNENTTTTSHEATDLLRWLFADCARLRARSRSA